MPAMEKDDISTPDTLTGDGAGLPEPSSENAAKPPSPRPVHGVKV